MSFLQEIGNTVQKTAEAISDVLKIEVEIADDKLVRIAGTGKYKAQCGNFMPDGFVYQHVLDTGNTVIIENPGYNELCLPCPNRENCCENGEIAAPILLNGRPIGVIGLIGFDQRQAKRLLDNKAWMLQFIVKMAELIVNNLVEKGILAEKHTTILNLENLEKETIIKALEEVSGDTGSKDRAAELLGISRATLYRKIKEYQIL